ncbi:MAG: hypothetical protein IKK32_04355 [Oscillospiraceae bacterium]|nr:hypothetical protein [Oscillospiraceae bacterium]
MELNALFLLIFAVFFVIEIVFWIKIIGLIIDLIKSATNYYSNANERNRRND